MDRAKGKGQVVRRTRHGESVPPPRPEELKERHGMIAPLKVALADQL